MINKSHFFFLGGNSFLKWKINCCYLIKTIFFKETFFVGIFFLRNCFCVAALITKYHLPYKDLIGNSKYLCGYKMKIEKDQKRRGEKQNSSPEISAQKKKKIQVQRERVRERGD